MTEATKVLLEAALALPEEERVKLVDGIWQSLGDAARDELYESDPMTDPEFRAMIVERSNEAHEHPERLIDGETFLAELRARHEKVPKP